MPVGGRLYTPGEIEQREIGPGRPTICTPTGMPRWSNPAGKRNGGQAQHIDEAGEAAQRVERPGREAIRARVAFGRVGVTIAMTGNTATSAPASTCSLECPHEARPRDNALGERGIRDLQALGQPAPQRRSDAGIVEPCPMRACAFSLHDDHTVAIDLLDRRQRRAVRGRDAEAGQHRNHIVPWPGGWPDRIRRTTVVQAPRPA